MIDWLRREFQSIAIGLRGLEQELATDAVRDTVGDEVVAPVLESATFDARESFPVPLAAGDPYWTQINEQYFTGQDSDGGGRLPIAAQVSAYVWVEGIVYRYVGPSNVCVGAGGTGGRFVWRETTADDWIPQGVTDHAGLTGRDEANCHPQTAIGGRGGQTDLALDQDWQDTNLVDYQVAMGLDQDRQDQNLVDHQLAADPHEAAAFMKLLPDYTSGDDVREGHVVLDQGYLCCALTDTSAPAAPQKTGDPQAVYTGTMATDSATASQIIFGNRYSFPTAVQFVSYRIYVESGNTYQIFTVVDPLGAVPEAVQLLSFVATTTGWREFGAGAFTVPAGTELDLVARTSIADTSPTIYSGSWNYLTPNNASAPGAGNASQANKLTDELRFNKTDNDGNDEAARGWDLSDIGIGDIITTEGVRWTVQSYTDQGNWVSYGVAPASQLASDGVKTFDFEQTAAVPVTYPVDPGYWTTSEWSAQAAGLIAIDDAYENATVNTNAYGVDIVFQPLTLSPDWKVLTIPPQ